MKEFFKSLFRKETYDEFWVDADKVLLEWFKWVAVLAIAVAIAYWLSK